MIYYDYIVKNPDNGRQLKGVIPSTDMETAVAILKNRGLILLQIEPMKDFLGIRHYIYKSQSAVKKKDIQEFFDQLAFMLATDLQLYSALLILRDFSVNKKIQTIATSLSSGVRNGMSLDEAMTESKLFEPSLVQQVKAGINSGDVPNTLERLSTQLERELEFSGKIKNAMIYPIFILIVMVVVLWVLLTMVVPSLAETLVSMGGNLPLVTKIVVAASNFMANYTIYMIIVIIALIAAYKYMRKTSKDFSIKTDGMKLQLPIIGNLLTKMDMARLCRNLSSMQHSGISLVTSLQIIQTAVKNLLLRRDVKEATEQIETSGISLSAALARSKSFPELMVQLIEVGVSSGKVPDVLDKIATQYEKEVDEVTKRITSLIEPIMIVVIGSLVGTVVISMFLPMFSLIDTMG